MIIKYRLNLDQGRDQAQLTWPLPLTSARNRASNVHHLRCSPHETAARDFIWVFLRVVDGCLTT